MAGRVEYNKRYYAEHREQIRVQAKEYYQKNADALRAYGRWYYSQNQGRYIKRAVQWNRDNAPKADINRRRSILKLKQEVLTHYSSEKLACVICGFADILALSIDHINGGGAEHRRSLVGYSHGFGGKDFYRWLKKNNYPEGYRTLCMNCQFIERYKGKYRLERK